MLLKRNSKLILKDGSIFHGFSFGSDKSTSGEVVFSTGMVGYPESLTDPSYKGQILCLTYPLVGNYGIPSNEKDKFNLEKNFESERIHIQGLVISDYSFNYSHWNAKKSLADWLKEHDIPAIFGIDTRELTKKLREQGSMLGKIVVKDDDIDFYDPNKIDLVKQVSIKDPIIYDFNDKKTINKNSITQYSIKKNKNNFKNNNFDNLDNNGNKKLKNINNLKSSEIKYNGSKRIILIDCGVKNNIIRNLVKRNLTVIRVPYDYDFLKLDFDGIVISNGPGNPKFCKRTVKNIKKAIKKEIPLFGICLGNQLLSLAAGADTYKLKYGHRSQNQPCLMKGTKRCFITTQNHGYAVDTATLSSEWQPLFTNVNDNTNEGIRHKTKPFISVQFHPEAYPGPVDTEFLFDEFVKKLE